MSFTEAGVLLSAKPLTPAMAWATGSTHAADLRSRPQSVCRPLDLAPCGRAPDCGGLPGAGAVPAAHKHRCSAILAPHRRCRPRRPPTGLGRQPRHVGGAQQRGLVSPRDSRGPRPTGDQLDLRRCRAAGPDRTDPCRPTRIAGVPPPDGCERQAAALDRLVGRGGHRSHVLRSDGPADSHRRAAHPPAVLLRAAHPGPPRLGRPSLLLPAVRPSLRRPCRRGTRTRLACGTPTRRAPASDR